MVPVIPSDFRRSRRMRALAYGRKRQGKAAPVWCVTWVTSTDVEHLQVPSYVVARGIWRLLSTLGLQPLVYRRRTPALRSVVSLKPGSPCHA